LTYRQIEAAIAKLGKQLRSAESLPLKIVAVQPLSAAARHTAAFPPLPHPFAGGQRSWAKIGRCLETIDLLAQLEGSGIVQVSGNSLHDRHQQCLNASVSACSHRLCEQDLHAFVLVALEMYSFQKGTAGGAMLQWHTAMSSNSSGLQAQHP